VGILNSEADRRRKRASDTADAKLVEWRKRVDKTEAPPAGARAEPEKDGDQEA